MAMAPPLSSFLISSAVVLLSLQLLCCSSVAGQLLVHGDDRNFRVVSVNSLMPPTVCSPSKARGRHSLKIIHRHGPCNPRYAGNKLDHLQALALDSLRVASLQARLSRRNATQLQASKVSLPTQRGTGNYVVTLGLGTPNKHQTVDIDTGSDLCWVQCEPCVAQCYPQKEPKFDPSASSTYRNISCTSPDCDSRSCFGGTCIYHVLYGDGSFTEGFLATETLTVTPTDVFTDFVFGCGQNNGGLFQNDAGLFGLGRGRHSLVSQTASTLGNVFSYCLPPRSSSTGFLNLGKTSATSAVYTPMLINKDAPSFYFIDLMGISVGGKQLPVSRTVFNTVGTIIDSGTVITRLPPSAYDEMRSAFRSAMSQYPPAQPSRTLDTCYDFSKEGNITFPVITLHYDAVDVTLGFEGVFFIFDVSRACLAFAGNKDPRDVGIIGNTQQLSYEVIYDIGAKKIGFAPGTCG